ncbi:MAG: LysR family transcriptional regulator [Alphaproteobacteria bacterium]|nr:LysR family transcriptional regulator [Alphaproteobacteria bacterium]
MKIKWLYDFLALSAEGNFRASAEQRGVSQPAFSRRIRALESWVGVALIDRDSQPSHLTEAGKLFLPAAKKIVDIANASKAEILRQAGENDECIRFATLATLSQIFIPAWLRSLQPFIATNRIIVRTEYGTIADYFVALDKNMVDFFISYLGPNAEYPTDVSSLMALKLGAESLVPVASPNRDGSRRWWLPEVSASPIPCLHKLSDHSPWPIKKHMQETYRDQAFMSVYDSSIGTTLREMAIEGFGLAWLPQTLVCDDLKSGRLVRAAKPADDICVDIMIYRCSKYNDPKVEKIWNIILQQVRGHVAV